MKCIKGSSLGKIGYEKMNEWMGEWGIFSPFNDRGTSNCQTIICFGTCCTITFLIRSSRQQDERVDSTQNLFPNDLQI